MKEIEAVGLATLEGVGAPEEYKRRRKGKRGEARQKREGPRRQAVWQVLAISPRFIA